MAIKSPQPRLSGHETFVCRFAWLPKVVMELNRGRPNAQTLFKDENDAMVRLGVGKNMVRSIRFWAESADIIEPTESGGFAVTQFGNLLLGHDGYDQYLERPETLWLLHWKITTKSPPLFFWHQMLNFWHRPEFSISEALPFLKRGLPAGDKKRSDRTLSDGFRVFVNSYVPTRGKKGEIREDNLDCPLVELGLIQKVGERDASNAQGRELIYAFRIEDKPEISDALFAYCLNEFWNMSPHSGETLAFRFISSGEGSPGQVFKLPEISVRGLLERQSSVPSPVFEFKESSSLQEAHRQRNIEEFELLEAIYSND